MFHKKTVWVSPQGLMEEAHVFQLACLMGQNQDMSPCDLNVCGGHQCFRRANPSRRAFCPQYWMYCYQAVLSISSFKVSLKCREPPCLTYPSQGDPYPMTDLCRPGHSIPVGGESIARSPHGVCRGHHGASLQTDFPLSSILHPSFPST